MSVLWGILGAVGCGMAGFLFGAYVIGVNLEKIIARLSAAQLGELADKVIKERKRGHSG